jgi:hypothetical protein
VENQVSVEWMKSKGGVALKAPVPPGAEETPSKPLRMKRVSFYVPEHLYDDIQAFAQERGETITGVLRWSLGVGKVIWDEIKQGHAIRSTPPKEGDMRRLIFSR